MKADYNTYRAKAMKIRTAKQQSKAFSLIDTLIAAAVLALGLIAIASFNTDLISTSALSKNRAQAVALSQEKLEELRTNLINDSAGATAANFAKIVSGTENCGANTFPCGNAGFARSWTVANHAALPETKRITVNVNWTDADNEAQTVTLEGMVSWDNPSIQIAASDQDSFGLAGGIDAPTGGGKLVTDSTEGLSGDSLVPDDETNYNLKVVENGDGVAVYQEGSLVWLSVAPGVVRLTGNICLSTDDPPNQFTVADLSDGTIRSIAADAGICRERFVAGSCGEFVCYVGSKWFGRISIMALEGDKLTHVSEYGNGQMDRICPTSYRYRDSCEVTGQYTRDSVVFCSERTANANFVPGDTPLVIGTLANQNFMIQDADAACSDALSISGTVTLSGEEPFSITSNNILVTASGTALGCFVTEDSDNDNLGTYRCEVPLGWGSTGETVTFDASGCSGKPSQLVYTEVLTADVVHNVSYSGCTQAKATVEGSVTENDATGISVTTSGGHSCTYDEDADTYACAEMAAGWSGDIIINSNCGEVRQAYTVAGTIANDSTVSGPDFTLCETITYTISGNLNNTSNKWEVGSGNTKAGLASLVVNMNGNACFTVPSPSDQVGAYPYSCTISTHRGSSVVLAVSACTNETTPRCFTSNPTYHTVVLDAITDVTGKSFDLSPP